MKLLTNHKVYHMIQVKDHIKEAIFEQLCQAISENPSLFLHSHSRSECRSGLFVTPACEPRHLAAAQDGRTGCGCTSQLHSSPRTRLQTEWISCMTHSPTVEWAARANSAGLTLFQIPNTDWIRLWVFGYAQIPLKRNPFFGELSSENLLWGGGGGGKLDETLTDTVYHSRASSHLWSPPIKQQQAGTLHT